MKIFGVGRNYVDHAKELQNEVPSEPVIFLMPDTALLKNNQPFYYPDFSKDIHHEIEVVIRINREGKNIEPEFAHKYFDQIGLGIDFTARDLQSELKSKGLPWSIAKGFNGSLPISDFLNKDTYDITKMNFSLEKNEEVVQKGNTKDMLFGFDLLIAYISRFFLLKTGDLIFTGTPAGVSSVSIGDKLIGKIENEIMLNFEVK